MNKIHTLQVMPRNLDSIHNKILRMLFEHDSVDTYTAITGQTYSRLKSIKLRSILILFCFGSWPSRFHT